MSGFPEDLYGIQPQDLHVKNHQHFLAHDLRYVAGNVPHGYPDIRRGFVAENLHGMVRPTVASHGMVRPAAAAHDLAHLHRGINVHDMARINRDVANVHDVQQRMNRNIGIADPRTLGIQMHTEHPPNIMASREPIVTATRSQAIEIELLERQQVLDNLQRDRNVESRLNPAQNPDCQNNSGGSQTNSGDRGQASSAGGGEQTTGGGHQSSGGDHQSSGGGHQTSGGGHQTSGGGHQTSGGDHQNKDKIEKKSGSDEEFDEDLTSESDLGEMICIEPELGFIKSDEDSKTGGSEDLKPETKAEDAKETASFKCIECDLYFPKKKDLYLHKRAQHNPKFLCELCEFATCEISSLKKHKLSVHDKVKHPCDQCAFQASCVTVLKEHKLTQHVKIKHPCNLCSFVTFGKRNLKRHMMKMHADWRPSSMYNCDECDFSAPYSFVIKEHKETHHEGKEFSCDFDQCQFTTLFRKELLDHKKEAHNGIKKEEKLYPCTQCEYVGNQMGNLNAHIRSVHEGIKPVKQFPCTMCDYVGTYKCNLNSHVKSQHEGVKPDRIFPCDQCTYVATYKSNLKAHVKSRHDGIKSDKVFPCPQCQYVSSYRSNLNSHIKSQHEGLKTNKEYPCEQCDYVGSYKCNLNEHKKRKHGVPKELPPRQIPLMHQPQHHLQQQQQQQQQQQHHILQQHEHQLIIQHQHLQHQQQLL